MSNRHLPCPPPMDNGSLHAVHKLILLWFGALASILAGGCTDMETETGISDSLAMIEAPRLREHVAALTEIAPRSARRPAALRNTTQYIQAELTRHGVRVSEEPLESTGEDAAAGNHDVNLIAVFPGVHAGGEIFEIGAHYDTVENTPGADDNASGVAALLEISRVLAGLSTHRTIRLCFFAREEDGLGGSTRHVNNINQRDEHLAGAIILEMIGYTDHAHGSQGSPARLPLLFWPPHTGNFIAVVGNFRSGSIGNRFEAAAARYVPELRLFSANRLGGLFRDALRGDHKPYWDHGRRAIMLTDTANFRNPHYHRPGDIADTLDYEFMAGVTRASLATALTWSGLRRPPANQIR